jgi:hypothetical protein
MAINLTIDEIRSGIVRQADMGLPEDTVQARVKLLADARMIAKRMQQPCDIGLFGDAHKQAELF